MASEILERRGLGVSGVGLQGVESLGFCIVVNFVVVGFAGFRVQGLQVQGCLAVSGRFGSLMPSSNRFWSVAVRPGHSKPPTS